MSFERRVGERGQVTIPKEFRDEEGLRAGDTVEFEDRDGEIVIKKVERTEELKEAYTEMAERDLEVHEEWKHASKEADELL